MNIFRGFDCNFGRAVVAVGSFDGVHSGHRLLIGELNRSAKERDAEAVVVTFSPHPRQVLGRGECRLLSSTDEKLRLLEEAGAKNVVVVDFTKEFAAIEAEVFVRDYLVGGLGAVAIMQGSDHNFGRGGRGGIAELEKNGLEVIYLGRFDDISSTMVREAVLGGDMAKVKELMGAPYLVMTPIEKDVKILPPEGEYNCVVEGEEKVLAMNELCELRDKLSVRIIGVK